MLHSVCVAFLAVKEIAQQRLQLHIHNDVLPPLFCPRFVALKFCAHSGIDSSCSGADKFQVPEVPATPCAEEGDK